MSIRSTAVGNGNGISRFRLAVLFFLLILPTSIGVVWLCSKAYQASVQKAVVHIINNDNGMAWYAYQSSAPGADDLTGTPPGPSCLRDLLGIDFFSEVVSVDLREPNALSHLGKLPRLSALRLYGKGVTDAEMEHVASLSGLELLSLNNTRVTDHGLTRLSTLRGLKWLAVSGYAITDESLPTLTRMRSLQWLMLDQTRISPAGVKKLQKALPACTVVGDEM